mmetsp:Transcript_20999/g.53386  ORF Transcript_20999/g.53386 Transcript_20999/m.53386 type:complete len:201 (-) Transcript_20999:631-1233(-)
MACRGHTVATCGAGGVHRAVGRRQQQLLLRLLQACAVLEHHVELLRPVHAVCVAARSAHGLLAALHDAHRLLQQVLLLCGRVHDIGRKVAGAMPSRGGRHHRGRRRGIAAVPMDGRAAGAQGTACIGALHHELLLLLLPLPVHLLPRPRPGPWVVPTVPPATARCSHGCHDLCLLSRDALRLRPQRLAPQPQLVSASSER